LFHRLTDNLRCWGRVQLAPGITDFGRSQDTISVGRCCLLIALLIMPVLSLISGCGYHVGAPYNPEIRSVHVPIFTSDLFRRDINIELTEAVQKEIRARTPFQLSSADRADTRLIGHVVEVNKSVLGETSFDDPRQLQLGIGVEVLWEETSGGQLLARQTLPIDPQTRQLLTQANFAPEIGQSYATAKHEAISRLARRIVDMMESPW